MVRLCVRGSGSWSRSLFRSPSINLIRRCWLKPGRRGSSLWARAGSPVGVLAVFSLFFAEV